MADRITRTLSLLRLLTLILTSIHTSPIEEEWYDWRPMTWDGKPIIDRSPAFENVWIAAGHNMLGISMATGTGHMIDSMIRGEERHLDASHFRLSRLCKAKI